MPLSRRSHAGLCLRCGGPTRTIVFTPADYTALLGLYLGDGYIVTSGRTQRLRLYLDAKYPTVIDWAEYLLEGVFPANRIGRSCGTAGGYENSCVANTIVVGVYSSHLACLFPQHGRGRKHERVIRLEPWQQRLVDVRPWPFLKGCIYSDGSSFINRTGRYEYLSYEFSNYSADILDIVERTCRRVGLSPRRYERCMKFYRREDVARMVEHIGRKS